MAAMTFLCSFGRRCGAYDRRMLPTEITDTKILTLELPEADWRALRTIEPDAVGWLQTQIRTRLSGAPPRRPSPLPIDENDAY